MPPVPYCPSLIVCQQARIDEKHGVHIMGMINGYYAPGLPHKMDLAIVLTLTAGEGEYRLRLDIGHEPSETIVKWCETTMELKHPQVVTDRILPVEMEFALPGRYWFSLSWGGHVLAQRSLDIKV